MEFRVLGGSLTANARIVYSREIGWNIRLTGPFGMLFALLESSGEWYYLTLPQTSQIRQGSLKEGIDIPEIGITIPPIERLDQLFLPLPDILADDRWELAWGELGERGTIIIRKATEGRVDSLKIAISTVPFRVTSEEWFQNGEPTVKRSYRWVTATSRTPADIEVAFDELNYKLTYNSVKIEKQTSKPKAEVLP